MKMKKKKTNVSVTVVLFPLNPIQFPLVSSLCVVGMSYAQLCGEMGTSKMSPGTWWTRSHGQSRFRSRALGRALMLVGALETSQQLGAYALSVGSV